MKKREKQGQHRLQRRNTKSGVPGEDIPFPSSQCPSPQTPDSNPSLSLEEVEFFHIPENIGLLRLFFFCSPCIDLTQRTRLRARPRRHEEGIIGTYSANMEEGIRGTVQPQYL